MLLHEFYSVDKTRKATVSIEPDKSFTVCMIEDGAVVENRNITGHSEQYSEDCAENWVLGVM